MEAADLVVSVETQIAHAKEETQLCELIYHLKKQYSDAIKKLILKCMKNVMTVVAKGAMMTLNVLHVVDGDK